MLKSVYGSLLLLECCLQLSDQPLLDRVKLVQLVLMHSLPLQMVRFNRLISALNRLIVHITVILLLELGLLPPRILTSSIALLVVQIGVAELRDGIVVLVAVRADPLAGLEVFLVDAALLLLDSCLVLILAEVVQLVLTLPVVLQVVEPVVPVVVVGAPAVIAVVSEVGSLVGNFHLTVEAFLLAEEFLEPVFHG